MTLALRILNIAIALACLGNLLNVYLSNENSMAILGWTTAFMLAVVAVANNEKSNVLNKLATKEERKAGENCEGGTC